MTPSSAKNLQPGDRLLIRFRHGEQYAVVVRLAATQKGDVRLWVAPWHAKRKMFYESLRAITPSDVIWRCAADEFTIPYPPTTEEN